MVNYLKETANKLGFQILASCFMPDHVHILIGADGANNDLIKFKAHFKLKTGYEFKKKARF